MKEHVAQRHLVLPAGPELRPHVDDAQVVGDVTAFDEDVRQRGRHALRSGTGPEQGVAIDGRSGARIGCTACRVDERVTVPDDRDLHPDLLAGTDHVIEERVDGGGKLVFTHVDDSDDRRPSNSSLARTTHVGYRPDGVPHHRIRDARAVGRTKTTSTLGSPARPGLRGH